MSCSFSTVHRLFHSFAFVLAAGKYLYVICSARTQALLLRLLYLSLSQINKLPLDDDDGDVAEDEKNANK